MKKLCNFLLAASLAAAHGALAAGGSGGGSLTSGKKKDDALPGVTFPTIGTTGVLDDSRVRAATTTFTVPQVAPIPVAPVAIPSSPIVPTLAAPRLPAIEFKTHGVDIPSQLLAPVQTDLRRDDRVLSTSRRSKDGTVEVRSGDRTLEAEARGSDKTLETEVRQAAEIGDTRGSGSDAIVSPGTTTIAGNGGYRLDVVLPMADPFAPWKTPLPEFVPACQ